MAILVAIGLAQSAKADVWRDAATGQIVESGPILDAIMPGTTIFSAEEPAYYRTVLPTKGDRNRAFAYVARDQAETSVLFELISARYESSGRRHERGKVSLRNIREL